MLYRSAEDNVLAPGVAELHLQPGEDITIILPEGDEIYVAADGSVSGVRPGPETAVKGDPWVRAARLQGRML